MASDDVGGATRLLTQYHLITSNRPQLLPEDTLANPCKSGVKIPQHTCRLHNQQMISTRSAILLYRGAGQLVYPNQVVPCQLVPKPTRTYYQLVPKLTILSYCCYVMYHTNRNTTQYSRSVKAYIMFNQSHKSLSKIRRYGAIHQSGQVRVAQAIRCWREKLLNLRCQQQVTLCY